MRRTLLLAALAAIALFVAAGCGSETTGGASPTTPAAPQTTAATSATAAPTQAAGDAATLFADNCAGCHGSDGGGGNGPDLRGEDNVGRVVAQIKAGGGGMPAFAGELTGAQIQALAAYVVSEL